MSDAVEPHRIEVPEEVLEDLRRRLAHTRLPDQPEGLGWEQGTELSSLRALLDTWREDYDWRATEARLNAWPNFRTHVDGQPVHFLHARSRHADALPLLLSHGWPGSVLEFLDVLGPLTDPEAHGCEARDAFHVVCPSLPGYGFSGPTLTAGWDTQRIAEAFAELMRRLGYDRYGAQGGDWGALVTSQLGLVDAEHLCGIHTNMPLATLGPTEGLSEAEKADLAEGARWQKLETGYQRIQGTKPQTLGYALHDSPAGLAAWILEKFRSWSDCGGDVERAFTREQLLANITLYWVTGTATSSARLYWETARHPERLAFLRQRVEVPTGVARFPREIMRYPRSWVERHYNVTHWSEMPRGGHFAAMEAPELLVDDLRLFFRSLR